MKQCLSLLVLFGWLILNANIINVPADFAEIQDALTASANGDTILVERGIYQENLEFADHNVTLASNYMFSGNESDISQTIIMGNYQDATIRFDLPGNVSEIIGFTLINGDGGIYCVNSSPSLRNLIITNNFSDNDGGGIYCLNADLIVENCRINNNLSEDEGGGIYAESSYLEIKNCQIYNNYADSDGGGGYLDSVSGFLENILCSNNFSNNDGGGFALIATDISVFNALMYNNEADDDGGALYCSSGATPFLANLTISGNSCQDKGGGIYCSQADATLINSVVVNNQGEAGFYAIYSEPSVSFCNVFNNEDENFHGFDNGVGEITTINRNGEESDIFYNIQYEPDFVFVNDEYFHPADTSVLVNAGADSTGFLPAFDLAGNVRLFGEFVDIGVYENQNVQVVGIAGNELPIIDCNLSNFPNPFNPATTISFSLSEPSSRVELTIYNIKGQQVKTFISNQLAAGRHSVFWNGKDVNGLPVSSGVYFCKLLNSDSTAETKNNLTSRKMLLLK